MERIDSDPAPFELVLSDWARANDGDEAGMQLLRQLRAGGKKMPLVSIMTSSMLYVRASRSPRERSEKQLCPRSQSRSLWGILLSVA